MLGAPAVVACLVLARSRVFLPKLFRTSRAASR